MPKPMKTKLLPQPNNNVIMKPQLFTVDQPRPKPQTLDDHHRLGGSRLRGKKQTKVEDKTNLVREGLSYDEVRADLKRMLPIAVTQAAVERYGTVWRGVIDSKGTLYLFAADEKGFQLSEVDQTHVDKVRTLFFQLLDKERSITELAKQKLTDEEQNVLTDKLMNKALDKFDKRTNTTRDQRHHTKNGKKLPCRSCGSTKWNDHRFGVGDCCAPGAKEKKMKKALPRPKAEKTKPLPKDTKASKVQQGSGAQKPRYSYPGEKGGAKKPAPQKAGQPARNPNTPAGAKTAPMKQPKETEQDPQQVPGAPAADPTVLANQLGISVPVLLRIVKRFHKNEKLGGRKGFITFMLTRCKEVAKKHHLDGDYFGQVYDAVGKD